MLDRHHCGRLHTGSTLVTLLGFDYGSHKIGVAVGQTQTATATALETLRLVTRKPDWSRIGALLEEWKPDALVVGLPHQLDGEESEMAPAARRFARQLEGRFRLPVHLVDERLSSREARSRLGRTAKLDPTRVDAMAAKLILETWLSEH